ncbi:MAG: arylsulfatase [Lautropia sp.]|nr:arylsulfatase [Lautropia sp.]
MNKSRMALLTGLAAAGVPVAQAADAGPARTDDEKPNVLVIMADDMGWSDIGAFGGEIPTPNLDALAEDGVRFTSFQVSPYSSPSRAMFLTGADPHQVGVGNLYELNKPEQAASPNYAGHLNERALTVAQRLQAAGYFTVLSGKWHLGRDEAHAPDRWGFDHSFAMLNGEANHFPFADQYPSPDGKDLYRIDGKLTDVPADFYSTDGFTDYLLKTLDRKPPGQPFFAFLAYTAPHSPLQAPPEDIARYDGQYLDGPKALAGRRLKQIERLKLLPEDHPLKPHALLNMPDWEKLSKDEQRAEARRMQVYAAMIDRMDRNIGRVLDHLKQKNELDNTVVMFMSDNGAAGASREKSKKWGKWIADNRNNAHDNMGAGSSYISTGPAWAQASMAPFALFKGFTSEGGIRSPLIVSGPGVAKGGIDGRYVNLADLVPTMLDLTKTDKRTPAGKVGLDGTSMLSALQQPDRTARGPEKPVALEIRGGRQVRQGNYKAVYLSQEPMGIQSPELASGRWQLFDVVQDPGETRDLSAEKADVLRSLIADYQRYAKRVGVVEVAPVE